MNSSQWLHKPLYIYRYVHQSPSLTLISPYVFTGFTAVACDSVQSLIRLPQRSALDGFVVLWQKGLWVASEGTKCHKVQLLFVCMFNHFENYCWGLELECLWILWVRNKPVNCADTGPWLGSHKAKCLFPMDWHCTVLPFDKLWFSGQSSGQGRT